MTLRAKHANMRGAASPPLRLALEQTGARGLKPGNYHAGNVISRKSARRAPRCRCCQQLRRIRYSIGCLLPRRRIDFASGRNTPVDFARPGMPPRRRSGLMILFLALMISTEKMTKNSRLTKCSSSAFWLTHALPTHDFGISLRACRKHYRPPLFLLMTPRRINKSKLPFLHSSTTMVEAGTPSLGA